jgi:hypothetical protein
VAKRKHGVLILECRDGRDPGSEGRFMVHMLRLMGIKRRYEEVKTRKRFLEKLAASPYEMVHVTTHGLYGDVKKKKFAGLWFQVGSVGNSDINALRGRLRGCTVVSTACLSGDKKFGRKLLKVTGCDYYIAPKGRPKFHNSICFVHIFYHKLLIAKKSVKTSVAEYNKGFKNPHKFELIPDGVGAPADPGRRAPVERTDQVVSRHPGQRVPDKTDRTSVGLFATGPTSGTSGAGDARARECLDDAGGLELLGLPLLPIVGLPNRWVTDCS